MAMAVAAPSPRLTRPRISTHLLLVSPKQAREILATEQFPQQRPLRAHHVQFLRQLIAAGHLRPGTTISFGVVDPRGQRGTHTVPRYLINGQHTLEALGASSSGPLWLQVEEIRVDTFADVARLYATYDRNLSRTWADLYATDRTLVDGDLTATLLNRLGAATTGLASGFTWQTRWQETAWVSLLRDSYIRVQLMRDWLEDMVSVRNGCHGPSTIRTLLLRAPVLSVLLVTYRFQPDLAHRFWPRVAADSGLEAGEPAHTLLRWLREHPIRHFDAGTYARHVATAWNAAAEDKPLRGLTGQKEAKAIRIAGTPHDGTQVKSYLTPAGLVVREPVALEVTP